MFLCDDFFKSVALVNCWLHTSFAGVMYYTVTKGKTSFGASKAVHSVVDTTMNLK